MNDILKKFSIDTIKNIDKDNLLKIVCFLKKINCDFIDDLLEDYLDLFTIDYDDFVRIYFNLEKKYSGHFLELIEEDMNYLEEFFN